MDTFTFAAIAIGALVVLALIFAFRKHISATFTRDGIEISGSNPDEPSDGARIRGSESRSGDARATDMTGAGASIDETRVEKDLEASSSPAPASDSPRRGNPSKAASSEVERSAAGGNIAATSGPGAVGVGGDANAPITTGSGNTTTSTGDIRDNSGQVAVGSNIAQSSGGGSAHVDNSRSVFDQRGQQVGGSQYNAARDMNIGREQDEPTRLNPSDRRLAQAVQAALERHGLEDVLFNLGGRVDLEVSTDTLGADAAAQARTLVMLCRENKQRAALVASLRDFEDGLLGTVEEEKAWLAWARELDRR
jgi:predicted transcriptional regulator